MGVYPIILTGQSMHGKMDDVEICFVIHRRTYIADVKILQQALKFQ